jgi:hypothetical protein
MPSPYVKIIERDETLVIPSVTSSVGAIVIAAEKGRLNELTLVTNEADFIQQFGEPDDVNYRHWVTCSEFLKQSNQLYVVRTEEDTKLVSGVTVGVSGATGSADEVPLSWPTPKESEYFPMSYDNIGVGGSTPSDPSQNPDKLEAWDGSVPVFGDGSEIYHVYGVGTGPYYDGISFVSINALDYEQLENLKEELVQAQTSDEISDIAQKYYTGTPATTAEPDLGDYLSNSLLKYDIINEEGGGVYSVNSDTLEEYTAFEFGPEIKYDEDTGLALIADQQDEFAVIVYNEKNSPVESYIVSKDKDATNSQGNRIFAPDVINANSSYIYFFLGKSETAANGLNIISTGRVYLEGADELSDNLGDLTGEIQSQFLEHFTNKEILEIDFLLDPDYVTILKQTLDDIAKNIRKDCFAVLNVPVDQMINTSTGRQVDQFVTKMKNYVSSTLNINSSYSSIYGQYFRYFDRFNEKERWVPTTGFVAGVMAKTDYTNNQWTAPAGLNRGIISGVQGVAVNYNQGQRDVLYDARINTIPNFFGEGIVIWGQKTLLSRPSAFDRINVRRLFLYMERAIEKMARYLLFEFNDDFTRNRFRSQVNPFLADIQTKRGITDYLVVCDESNNTSEVIDNNEFKGDIYVKPTRVAEFITLTFTAVATGVEFSEVVG